MKFLLGIGVFSLLLNYLNIRICPFYYFFKIPCPGCGLTRSYLYLFQLDIKMSLQYNILAIPLLFYVLIMVYLKSRKYKIKQIWKKLFIFMAILFTLLTFLLNINNPLLY